MTVYVDQMRAPFGRMVMCHMMADTTEELLAMADKIGLPRKWIQDAGTSREHFDVSLTKRKAACEHGASEAGIRILATLMARKRAAGLAR